MTLDKRRGALLKASQAVEREAGFTRKNIEDVCRERERRLNELEAKLQELESDRSKLLLRMKQVGLQNGDLAELSSLSSYDTRMKAKLISIRNQINEQKVDLERARERANLAHQEEAMAHVERKKMEHLVERELQGQRIIREASEEAADDELFGTRKRN